MKEHYIAELAQGAAVDSLFVVRSRDLRAARTGDAYLALELSDRSGSMPAVMFRPGPQEWSVPAGAVARVRGRVTTYRGMRRVSVESLSAVAEFDREDMVASGSRKREELSQILDAMIEGIGHPGLRSLLELVYRDPGIRERFETCPATVRLHHAYIGGLLEHTLSVASLCKVLASRYDAVDPDLLVAAALLHDVGTIDELRYDTAVDLTERGRLLGHIVLGERIMSRAIELAGGALDAGTAARLVHLVISHHCDGAFDTGPRPVLIEAVVLHHADDLDSHVAGFMQAVAGAAVMEEPWSDAANSFGRSLMVPADRTGPRRERGLVPAGR